MKKIILSFGLVWASNITFSQTSDQRPKDIKDSPIIKSRIEQEQLIVGSDIKISEYFGLENNILDVLVNGVIPSELPKSITFSDKLKYIEVVNLWLKQNPDFVKREKRNMEIKP